jgi:hypothetical protein
MYPAIRQKHGLHKESASQASGHVSNSIEIKSMLILASYLVTFIHRLTLSFQPCVTQMEHIWFDVACLGLYDSICPALFLFQNGTRQFGLWLAGRHGFLLSSLLRARETRLSRMLQYNVDASWSGAAFQASRVFGVVLAMLSMLLLVMVNMMVLFVRLDDRRRLLHLIIRVLVPIAFVGSIFTLVVFSMDECQKDDMQCPPGAGGVVAIMNMFVFAVLSVLVFRAPTPSQPVYLSSSRQQSFLVVNDAKKSPLRIRENQDQIIHCRANPRDEKHIPEKKPRPPPA